MLDVVSAWSSADHMARKQGSGPAHAQSTMLRARQVEAAALAASSQCMEQDSLMTSL